MTFTPGCKLSPDTPVHLTDELGFGKAPGDKLVRTDTCRAPTCPLHEHSNNNLGPIGLCTPSQEDHLEIHKGVGLCQVQMPRLEGNTVLYS